MVSKAYFLLFLAGTSNLEEVQEIAGTEINAAWENGKCELIAREKNKPQNRELNDPQCSLKINWSLAIQKLRLMPAFKRRSARSYNPLVLKKHLQWQEKIYLLREIEPLPNGCDYTVLAKLKFDLTMQLQASQNQKRMNDANKNVLVQVKTLSKEKKAQEGKF